MRSITHELPADLAGDPRRRERARLARARDHRDGRHGATPTRRSPCSSELTALGIRLSVDDFGTGFSSLAYLKRLPVSAIKIDRSFVMEMDHDDSDRAIVRSTIDLARHLGMEVVAEGVRPSRRWRSCAQLGCHLAQGFVISPPLAPEALEAWLAKGGFQPAWELQAARPTAPAPFVPPRLVTGRRDDRSAGGSRRSAASRRDMISITRSSTRC